MSRLVPAGEVRPRVQAVRGAIQVDRDDADAIIEATTRLLSAVLAANDLADSDLVSILFTATDDLTAAFPAAAARAIGLTAVPLMCARELAVPGSLPRVIRLMAHVETARRRSDIQHIYLDGAQALRPDLAPAR